ncbi:hypothetical protein Ct61P_15442 [Colletotrichum tofieldiae]|nr:hypothetical protein Ct61P_15442 [Colletotrichum tofieldiae]
MYIISTRRFTGRTNGRQMGQSSRDASGRGLETETTCQQLRERQRHVHVMSVLSTVIVTASTSLSICTFISISYFRCDRARGGAEAEQGGHDLGMAPNAKGRRALPQASACMRAQALIREIGTSAHCGPVDWRLGPLPPSLRKELVLRSETAVVSADEGTVSGRGSRGGYQAAPSRF